MLNESVSNTEPELHSQFISHASKLYLHSAAITRLSNGDLYSVWFAGTREGASDVQIYSSRYDRRTERWSTETPVVSRLQTEQALNQRIRKLGNPVVSVAPDGKLWLFYVSVSLGGWATSSINFMTSMDNGLSWTSPRRLVTSPFLNLSTLVRGQPIFYDDGSLGIPIYHEALGKFPEFLRLDPDGHIFDKVRLDYGRDTLQPFPVVLDHDNATFLLRDGSENINRVRFTQTHDNGESWSTPETTGMANPNSALTAVRYDENEILVVLNDLEETRFQISAFLTDHHFQHWRRLAILDEAPVGAGKPVPFQAFRHALAKLYRLTADSVRQSDLPAYIESWNKEDPRGCKRKGCEFHFDYPFLIQTQTNRFDLVYSWNKSMIKHTTITRAWVEKKRQESLQQEALHATQSVPVSSEYAHPAAIVTVSP